jgi:leader peptidase (prepilin peptidase)/N-methyltransferase
MPLETLTLVFVAVLGLVSGSAVTALSHRIPRDMSFVRGRSVCPNCGRTLGVADLFPVLSFVLQRGRCRSCGHPIGWRYPLTELACAAWFVMLYLRLGLSWEFTLLALWGVILVTLVWIDVDFQLLPDVLTYPGILIGMIYALLQPDGWKRALLGAAVGSGTLGLVALAYWRVRRVEGMGIGDIKLAAMMGVVLGWEYTLLAFFVAAAVGSLWGASLIVSGKGHAKTALPFGALLAPAAMVALLWGPTWLMAYMGLMRGGR